MEVCCKVIVAFQYFFSLGIKICTVGKCFRTYYKKGIVGEIIVNVNSNGVHVQSKNVRMFE